MRKIVLLVLIFTLINGNRLSQKMSPENEQQMEQIVGNKYGRQILVGIQQQILKEDNNSDELMDILSQLEFDILDDEKRDYDGTEKDVGKCEDNLQNLSLEINNTEFNLQMKDQSKQQLTQIIRQLDEEIKQKEFYSDSKLNLTQEFQELKVKIKSKYDNELEKLNKSIVTFQKIEMITSEMLDQGSLNEELLTQLNLIFRDSKFLRDSTYGQFIKELDDLISQEYKIDVIKVINRISGSVQRDLEINQQNFMQIYDARISSIQSQLDSLSYTVGTLKKQIIDVQDNKSQLQLEQENLDRTSNVMPAQIEDQKDQLRIMKIHCENLDEKYQGRKRQRDIQYKIIKDLQKLFQNDYEGVVEFLKGLRIQFIL